MRKEEKNKSIEYWNKHAEKWRETAFDKRREYLNFPTAEVRKNITVNELEKIAKSKSVSIIDLGCGSGELIIDLIKKGFFNVKGVDNSESMVRMARENLKSENLKVNEEKVFRIVDVDKIRMAEKFDFITAMGLVEYLLDVDEFFRKLPQLLEKNGYAFIELRNKLFNLYSANDYTIRTFNKSLVEELQEVGRFSPIQDYEVVEKMVRDTFSSIGEVLGQENEKKRNSAQERDVEKFPFETFQFSPTEIENMCNKNGLSLEYVIYYHPHPFLPKFEKEFPKTFNKIAFQMKSLGFTPIGANICSAFIAVIKKS